MLDDDELEPPAPASLAHLSDPSQTVAGFLNLDPYLIAAAAENSTAFPHAADSDRTVSDLLMRAAQLRSQAG
ncbi:hypothetical protein GCM10022223_45710 [Kineosporia mesophila]|uniref:Uncharacterized protein n=1 Tax=Kineosporia mesophila TaxID=566012 RepID=A0ABP7A2F6_9ACTN|nr:hypothetical protein [Kineosporia mesophila]MCD5348987.1 hypothetical protein [Kineosporia mesophila]